MAITERTYRTSPPSALQLDRGTRPAQLVATRSFEDVVHQACYGGVHDVELFSWHVERERDLRSLDGNLLRLLCGLPTTSHPLDVLRVAVKSLLPDRAEGLSADAERAAALGLLARIPTVVALDLRRRRGLQPIPPRADLGYVENLLHMCFGGVPEPDLAQATAIVLAAFVGPDLKAQADLPLTNLRETVLRRMDELENLRIGETEAVMRMLDQIADPDDAERWLAEALAERATIPSFRGGIGRRDDPDVTFLYAQLERIAAKRGTIEPLATYHVLISAMLRETGLRPDLNFPAGLLLRLIGFDHHAAIALVVVARLAEWLAPSMNPQTRHAYLHSSEACSKQASEALLSASGLSRSLDRVIGPGPDR